MEQKNATRNNSLQVALCVVISATVAAIACLLCDEACTSHVGGLLKTHDLQD